jgi:hypothetical protein
VDTLYGQLLRRMTADGAVRYAVVVPDKLVAAASRVPVAVRMRLDIDLYSVAMDDTVLKH